ncbi:hypothetical protein ACKC9G_14275 [Pokkaliibacter sp. CJK22405]|uniref:hypothetical protein n=1 Tax=Pokkaliibacter sp. CJK22405 TaxID=3384615 RepID=UPI0039850735
MAQLCVAGNTRILRPTDFESVLDYHTFMGDNPGIGSNNCVPEGLAFLVRTQQQDPNPQQQALLREFNQIPQDERRKISVLTSQLGGAGALALANAYEEHLKSAMQCVRKNGVDVSSAVAGGWGSRNTELNKQIGAYEDALKAVRNAKQKGVDRQVMRKLEMTAHREWQKLNDNFGVELKAQLAKAKGKGTIWNNSERAVNLAKSHRNDGILNISDSRDLIKLRRLAQASDYLGKGLIIADASFKVAEVYSDYESGKDWQRTATVNTTSFAFGFLGGTAAAEVSAGLAIGLVAIPVVGWVLAIGVGIGAAYLGSKIGSKAGSWASGSIYDRKLHHFDLLGL